MYLPKRRAGQHIQDQHSNNYEAQSDRPYLQRIYPTLKLFEWRHSANVIQHPYTTHESTSTATLDQQAEHRRLVCSNRLSRLWPTLSATSIFTCTSGSVESLNGAYAPNICSQFYKVAPHSASFITQRLPSQS